jgi:hypothetical protein
MAAQFFAIRGDRLVRSHLLSAPDRVLGPLAAFFVSDLILNAYYLKTPHVESLVSLRMIPEYLALGLSAAMGLWLRKNPRLA